MNMNRKKIVIGGGVYGFHNNGDEGLLRGILSSVGDCETGVITKSSDWILDEFPNTRRFELKHIYCKPRYGIYLEGLKKWKTWKDILFPPREIYRWGDVFLCGGGTLFTACPWNGYYLTKQFKKEGKKTIIWGAGMCEEHDPHIMNLIKKWCNDPYVAKIFVRDEFVKQRLLSLGVLPEKILISNDPAYALVPIEFNLQNLSEKALSLYRSKNKKIVLTLSGESDIKDMVNIDFFKELIRRLDKKKYNVFLIPISYSDHTTDREFLENLDSEMLDHVTNIKYEFKPSELLYFLQDIDLSISSRLHMSIYTAIVNKPFIALRRNDKNSDLAKLYGMPCYEFDNLYIEDMINNIDKIINAGQSKIKNIKAVSDKYKVNYEQMSKLLVKLINEM